MSKLSNWFKKELREILPVWVFFLTTFGLMALTFSAVLGEYHIEMSQPPEYIGGSLVMAKAVVIIDSFLKKQWLRDRPLFYAVVFNTVLYFAAGFTIRCVEQLSKLMWRQHLSLVQANQQILRAMSEPRYWAVIIWVIAVILAFSVVREIIGVIGPDRFFQMFFKRHTARTDQDIRKAS